MSVRSKVFFPGFLASFFSVRPAGQFEEGNQEARKSAESKLACARRQVVGSVFGAVLALYLGGTASAATLADRATGFCVTTPPEWKVGAGRGTLAVASLRLPGAEPNLLVMVATAVELEGWEERERIAALDAEVVAEIHRQRGRVRDIDRLGAVKIGRGELPARHVTAKREALSGPVRGLVVQDIYTFRHAHRKFTVSFVCPATSFSSAAPQIARVLATITFPAY